MPPADPRRQLRVIADTYRPVPDDVPYREQVEMATCRWCRWRSAQAVRIETPHTPWGNGPQVGTRCLHPQHVHALPPSYEDPYANPAFLRPLGWSERFNPDGRCPHYSTSRMTRLLRLFGFRTPAMGEPDDAS